MKEYSKMLKRGLKGCMEILRDVNEKMMGDDGGSHYRMMKG